MQNEFAHLADIHHADIHRAENDGLLELSVQLAATPLSPLYRRHVSPDRELAALVTEQSTRRQRGGDRAGDLP